MAPLSVEAVAVWIASPRGLDVVVVFKRIPEIGWRSFQIVLERAELLLAAEAEVLLDDALGVTRAEDHVLVLFVGVGVDRGIAVPEVDVLVAKVGGSFVVLGLSVVDVLVPVVVFVSAADVLVSAACVLVPAVVLVSASSVLLPVAVVLLSVDVLWSLATDSLLLAVGVSMSAIVAATIDVTLAIVEVLMFAVALVLTVDVLMRVVDDAVIMSAIVGKNIEGAVATSKAERVSSFFVTSESAGTGTRSFVVNAGSLLAPLVVPVTLVVVDFIGSLASLVGLLLASSIFSIPAAVDSTLAVLLVLSVYPNL